MEWDEEVIQKNGDYLNNLKFADDIVVMIKLTDGVLPISLYVCMYIERERERESAVGAMMWHIHYSRQPRLK